MGFLSIDEIYGKVKNKYLACVLISKRAKKYNSENYHNIISKGDFIPAGAVRRDPLKDAIKDFNADVLDDRIKEHE